MPGPAVRASSLIVRLARDLRTVLDQHFAELGLTSQQAGLLIHVFTGQSGPKGLADLLGIDTASVSRLVDRLEAKDLVRRAAVPGDRRAIVVELTPEGVALVPKLPPIFEAVGKQLVRGVDAKATAAALATMLGNVHALLPDPDDAPRRD
ncbi:MarR family winged helix-turn-helix transcriptional regulator [Dactylosporangium sp. CA-092794]|uniref:MarR family winged helix-turn-helix transcriptional regulator n=1 Tax=Dactylosporangium sp. CA-092794 TaxID=3239929 RepID=UPI003D90D73A